MPIFHLQFLSPRGWEAVGAGQGDGEDPLGDALAEVRGFCGGELAAGHYRVIESGPSDTTWTSFEVGPDGELLWA